MRGTFQPGIAGVVVAGGCGEAGVTGAASAADALVEIHAGDPYPVYERLRGSEPVYRTRSGDFLLFRYADCARVLSERGAFLAPGGAGPVEGAVGCPAPVLSRVMSSQNPPRHTRMRTAVARRFLEQVRRQEGWLAGLCDRLLDPVVEALRDGGVVDVTGVAEAFPRHTIMHILGLPLSDRDFVSRLVAAVFPASGPMPGQDGSRAAAAMRQLTDYLQAEVVSRGRAPGDDLTAELVRAHADRPHVLPRDELISILTGLMVAGWPQIAAGIETGVVLMIRHPRQAALLDDPVGARMFVDEALRYDAPVQFTPAPRIPVTTVRVGGVPLQAGAQVWPVLGAANRDPHAFARPDEFLPGRDGLRHLSFGGGAHFCLGAELVHVEMSMMLRRLRRRIPALELAQPPVQRLGRLRGFTSVPVMCPSVPVISPER